MMEEKFQKKYRVASARMEQWDYRWAAAYFITICTKNRVHYFGKIEDGKMVLSPLGILADVFWHEIKNHAKNVELAAFVVMPNHIHGILILNDNQQCIISENESKCTDNAHVVCTENESEDVHKNEMEQKTIGQQRFQNQGKNSVSSIIGGYKAAVTKHANRLGLDFGWQTRFHDHIIRDEKSFDTITHYIIHNPLNWEKDKFRDRVL